jgi:hypothetical protein
MRFSLLLVVAASPLLFANTAKAGLDWTLEECKQHYGKAFNEQREKSVRDM